MCARARALHFCPVKALDDASATVCFLLMASLPTGLLDSDIRPYCPACRLTRPLQASSVLGKQREAMASAVSRRDAAQRALDTTRARAHDLARRLTMLRTGVAAALAALGAAMPVSCSSGERAAPQHQGTTSNTSHGTSMPPGTTVTAGQAATAAAGSATALAAYGGPAKPTIVQSLLAAGGEVSEADLASSVSFSQLPHQHPATTSSSSSSPTDRDAYKGPLSAAAAAGERQPTHAATDATAASGGGVGVGGRGGDVSAAWQSLMVGLGLLESRARALIHVHGLVTGKVRQTG